MASISKTNPSQSTRKVDPDKSTPEIVAEVDQDFYDALPSRDDFEWAGVDDDEDFMVVLDKFKIERGVYEAIESSFDAMYSNLMEGVEYLPEELVGGYALDEYYDRLDGRMKTFLCLKHMAALPNARISVLQWNTFVIA